MADEEYSVVEYFKEKEGYRCGYCKNSDTNYSNGELIILYMYLDCSIPIIL